MYSRKGGCRDGWVSHSLSVHNQGRMCKADANSLMRQYLQEEADRLRKREGRGREKSWCILWAESARRGLHHWFVAVNDVMTSDSSISSLDDNSEETRSTARPSILLWISSAKTLSTSCTGNTLNNGGFICSACHTQRISWQPINLSSQNFTRISNKLNFTQIIKKVGGTKGLS